MSDTPQQPGAVQLKNEVKARVQAAEEGEATSARARVVQALADDVLKKRTTILSNALSKRNEMARELAKVKPDNVFYDEDGNEKKSFSKAAFEGRKKKTEQLGKLDKLIDAVLADPTSENYDKLEKAK